MVRNLDITGLKFGALTAVKPIVTKNKRITRWLFKCDCGKYKEILLSTRFKYKSCGCRNNCARENKYLESEASINEYRLNQGLTINELSKLSGVSPAYITGLNSGKISPIQERGKLEGGPTKAATALAIALGVSFDDLFPRYFCRINVNNDMTTDQILKASGVNFPDTPDTILDKLEMWELVRNGVSDRELDILKYRYIDNMSYEEVGEICFVCIERIRQLEHKALRKLRHPKNATELKLYY